MPDCQTAGQVLKNGALLAAGEAAGFEVLITTDQELPYQQNPSLDTPDSALEL